MAFNLAKKIVNLSEAKAFSDICVFLSHKKDDEKSAVAIGDYLMNEAGVNIYLDIYDVELQEAVSEENDKKIVSSIRRGLENSTHLLCLVSDRTHLSWWVPYEIGTADAKYSNVRNITTLKLKGIEDIPSFLKIHDVLYSSESFVEYAYNLDFSFNNFNRKYKGYWALSESIRNKARVNLKAFLD